MHRRSLAVVGAVAVLMVVARVPRSRAAPRRASPGRDWRCSRGSSSTSPAAGERRRRASCSTPIVSLSASAIPLACTRVRRRSGRMFRSWPRARRHSGSSRTPDTAAPSSTSTRAARGSTCRPGGSTTSCRRIRSVRAAHTWPRTPTAGGAGTPAVRALEPRRRRCSRAGTTASPRSTSNRRRGSLDT